MAQIYVNGVCSNNVAPVEGNGVRADGINAEALLSGVGGMGGLLLLVDGAERESRCLRMGER